MGEDSWGTPSDPEPSNDELDHGTTEPHQEGDVSIARMREGLIFAAHLLLR
jgi:hypothetical protein